MSQLKRSVAVVGISILLLAFAAGQTRTRTVQQYRQEVNALLKQPLVQTAIAYVDRDRPEILREWSSITEINAPSGMEKQRAAYIEGILRSLHLQDIHYDSAGNLMAVRKGSGGGPVVVFDAHMDTVFQPGLRIKTRLEGGKIFAPGIGDDSRNIEALLATVRALNNAQIATRGSLIFLFTVNEEKGPNGASQFVKDNKSKIDYYIALDGGYEGFTYGGIGINWYKHHYIGPGGHTRSHTPPYSATLPLARAILRIYDLRVPDDPPSNLNVGMLGGSDVVNAKAADAWFTVDLRSTSNEVIADLEKKIGLILKEEADRAGMIIKTEIISRSPAAMIPGHRDSYLVYMSEAVHRGMGFDNPPITPTGSNNSSAALLGGVPSISTGAGPCSDSHALSENCEIEPFYKGIKKILMLEIALAQLSR